MIPEGAISPPSPLAEAAATWLAQLETRLPALITAIVILAAGWLLAFVIRGLVRRLSRQAGRLLDRLFQRSSSDTSASQTALALLGELAFWITLLIVAALAAHTAGFTAIAAWLNAIVAYLPDLAAGAAIIVVGFIISVVLRDQVSTLAARTAGGGRGDLMGRLVQTLVVSAALIIGLGQIGIDVTLLVALAIVVTGAILLGFAMAFGFGARAFVADVIAARTLRRHVRPGMRVRIGAHEGEILEITATHIYLDTAEGKTVTPAHLATSAAILVLDAPAPTESPHG